MARHQDEVRQQKIEWEEFQKFKNESWEKWPAGPATMEACDFLVGLIKSGRLPDTEDAKHALGFHLNPFATNYPLSRTFTLEMQSNACVNHYTVVKPSAKGAWQLQRAWRTDARQNIVKTYSTDGPN